MTYRKGVCFLVGRNRRHVCVRCGSTYRRWQLAKCKFNAPVVSPGMGDRIAAIIKAVVKLLHVEQWIAEGPGCGCKKRREELNRFGRWLTKWRKLI